MEYLLHVIPLGDEGILAILFILYMIDNSLPILFNSLEKPTQRCLPRCFSIKEMEHDKETKHNHHYAIRSDPFVFIPFSHTGSRPSLQSLPDDEILWLKIG
mmetsp:Transcript_10116/g.17759  ORF Transcript_10116/g.17759 Transcript_10116/m.17759 type:complete len:101 (+) Transcript_10116:392-694(+)